MILLCAVGIALLAGLGYALMERQNAFRRSSERILAEAEELRTAFSQTQPAPAADSQPIAGVSMQQRDATDAEVAADASPAGIAASQAATSSAKEETAPATAQVSTAKPESGRIIFVGDSRTVGMQKSVNPYTDPCVFIGASGEGYAWFERSGIHRLERTLARYPDTPVVFNLGVNDTSSISQYIRSYVSLMEKYPDTDFWFLSVNPVTEDSLMVPDSDIVEFNHILKEAFPAQYLDSYSWMKEDGFESVDGIHYSEETYLAIHDFVFDCLFPQAEETLATEAQTTEARTTEARTTETRTTEARTTEARTTEARTTEARTS